MKRQLSLIHNDHIDLEKWDRTISQAINGRVYAYSWYLDIVAPDWHGLVYGDYEYLMPVVMSSRLGIRYGFQPTFAQQHGIFPPATPEITADMLDLVQKELKYFQIAMNALNLVKDANLDIQKRSNYILSLNDNYSNLRKKYNSHTRRYVNYAYKHCDVSVLSNVEEYLKFKMKYSHSTFTRDNLSKLRLILNKTISKNRGVILGAYSKRNELIGAAFFLYENKRSIYLNSVSSPEGKDARAMFAVVDTFIKENAAKHIVLDFEGSTIDGIARFFKGFGAGPEFYPVIKYNNLPWFIKLIKK